MCVDGLHNSLIFYVYHHSNHYLLLAAKESEALETCTSAKIKRTCEIVFEQLQTVRSKLAQSRRELEEVHSVSKCPDYIPDEVDQVFNEQHSWCSANNKCDDKPLFDGDPYPKLILWMDQQASEPQETHVPVSDASKLNFTVK